MEGELLPFVLCWVEFRNMKSIEIGLYCDIAPVLLEGVHVLPVCLHVHIIRLSGVLHGAAPVWLRVSLDTASAAPRTRPRAVFKLCVDFEILSLSARRKSMMKNSCVHFEI